MALRFAGLDCSAGPRSPRPLYVCACVSRKSCARVCGDVSLLYGICYTERYPYPPYLGFQVGGSPVATGLTANFTWWALIRRISTTAAVHRSGHYKLTATRDRPLTYEQANPPYRIGVTKSWNSWNTSILHTPNLKTLSHCAFLKSYINIWTFSGQL